MEYLYILNTQMFTIFLFYICCVDVYDHTFIIVTPITMDISHYSKVANYLLLSELEIDKPSTVLGSQDKLPL